MPPEKQNPRPVENNESPIDDSNEHYRPTIEANASDRAGFTRRSFEAIGKSLSKFLAEIKKPPYNIEIDENDDKSLAYGMFCFQRLLGPPDVQKDFLHDGMCGPATLRKFNEVKLVAQSKDSLHGLSGNISAIPPKSTTEPREAPRTASAVRVAEVTATVPETKTALLETNEKLPKIDISSCAFVGDSLMRGLKDIGALNGAIEPENYDRKRVTDKKGNVHIKEKGISIGGQQTPAMFNALIHAQENNELNDSKRMVVWGGINDIGSARSVKSIIESLTQIYKFAADNNMSIAACTLPDWRPSEATLKEFDRRWQAKGMGKYPYTADETVARIHAVNDWIRNSAQSVVPNTKLHVVDLNTELRNHPEKYHYNESILHPTKGYSAIAEYITTQAHITRQSPVAQK